MKNLELYIAKEQKIILSIKMSQGEVFKLIKSLDMSKGFPRGMSIVHKENLYYMQQKGEYAVSGNKDNIIEARKYEVNLCFDPFKRAKDQMDLERAMDEQSRIMDETIASKEPVTAIDDIVKKFNLLNIKFKKDGLAAHYSVNEEKKNTMLFTMGFFAAKTFGVEFDPLQAMDNYRMRDEQKKCFELRKGSLGQDPLRICSETAKHGRMFICFLGLIPASYVRFIRCIEHSGRLKFITPFGGAPSGSVKPSSLRYLKVALRTYLPQKVHHTQTRTSG